MSVTGAHGCIEECIAGARCLDPDVVLLDLARDDGVAAIRHIVAELPWVPTVVLGVPEDDDSVIACAEAGAAAYVTRDESLDDLHHTLLAVARGESPCSPKRVAMLLRRLAALAADPVQNGTTDVHLTPRESEVLSLIDAGLSNKQIAQKLCVELPTVKNHVHNILEKLGVDRRAQAAAWLRRRKTASI